MANAARANVVNIFFIIVFCLIGLIYDYFLLNLNPPPFKFSSIGFDTTVTDREYPYVLDNNRTAEYKYILQLPKNIEVVFVPESRTFSGKFGEFTVTSDYDEIENITRDTVEKISFLNERLKIAKEI